ncbi:endonuclease subunit [uncultured Caudovirales phage]|uniref:Endonuclease subunit n=1 Tax=uncultured Caudovirales phage TaxID=2100421 RepID=A0A6J7WVZ5_9CAUD|nr:endonuclease subunit [uncultured Caudovirales phage]
MILFKVIRWKNMLSTGNVFTEVQLDKNNTTLIVGENGAGKSTLLDALSLSLYSKPFRKVNKSQLINSINKKDLVVEVEFSIGPGNYKVIRGLKPAIFEVYKNGVLLNQDADSRDYQEVLENQILKLNHKSFCQVVVIGSASYIPFMQLSAQNRREIIEDMLDIQIFSTMNSLLKEKVSNNSTDLLLVTTETTAVSEKLKMTNEHIEVLSRNAEEQVDRLRAELRAIIDRAEHEKQSAKDYDQQIIQLSETINDSETVEKKRSKAQLYVHQLEAKSERLREDIKFLQTHEDCPTCKQNIDESFRASEVDKKLRSCTETERGVVQLKEEADKIDARLAEIRSINSTIADLSIKRITHSNNAKSLIQQAKKIVQDIDEAEKKATELLDASDLASLEADLEQLQIDKSELLKDKEALFVVSMVLKDTGIKSRIIKQYVPVINKLINKYLAALDFFVMFELDENFNETIKSRHRDDFSYASFSEGEKMRINLAILFTWRAVAKLRNSASTNILILDEVLDGSLDGNGTDEFLKILNNLTQDTNTFIISHKIDQMYDKFTNVLKFEKHKNFSRIAT